MIKRSGYIDGNFRELNERMKHSYDSSLPKWQGHWQNANIDRRYALGDQRYLNYFANPYYKEQKFIFNIIHAKLQQILGVQRRGRKSSVVVPSTQGSDQTASQLTKVLMWVMAKDNMLETISGGFYNAEVTGLNLMHIWSDDRDDPFSGDFRLKNYPSSSIIMDPWWTRLDLADCGFVWARDYLSLLQLQTMLPDRTDDLAKINPRSNNADIRFTFMPESYQVKYRAKTNYALDMYYYQAERERVMIHDMSTRQAKELPEGRDLDEFMRNEVPEDIRDQVKAVKQTIPTVRLTLSVCNTPLYDEHFADYYPFVPQVFYFDPESIDYSYRFQGIPRLTRDSQYLFNRRTQIQLDTLESLPTSGINVVEDALINEQDAFKTGPGQIRVVKKGYMPDQVISNIQPPQIDASAFQMTDQLSGLSSSILGITDEMMGMAEDNDVGIIEALRQGASLTTLRTPFDLLDVSQKILSERIVDGIQKNFTVGKVAQIIGEEPTEEFWDKAFFEYNVVVEDGLNTTTQKQMQFAQLMQLAALPKIGDLIDPADILEASTLQNKDKIIANMQAREQAQQQQAQAMQQAQMQQMQVQSELFASQSDYGRAGAEEKRASAVEKLASIEDEHDLALYRKAEALKKLDEVDINQINHLIATLEKLNNIANTPQEVKNG